MLLDDTVLPSTLRQPMELRRPYALAPEEVREACRALKGAMLRQEIYALDGTRQSDRPYTVTEQQLHHRSAAATRRQPARGLLHPPPRAVDFHYERKLVDVTGQKRADPRVSHAMTLEVDAFGNVLRSVAIGYGRRCLPGRRMRPSRSKRTSP